jgi:hypothetical protein
MGLTTQSLGRTAHLFSSNYSDCNKVYGEVIIAIFYPRFISEARKKINLTTNFPPRPIKSIPAANFFSRYS